jgi:hypothetical protein
MTYQEATEILRDAIGPRDELDLTTRLLASPGRLSVIDVSTAGELPEGDAYGDQILRSLMVVWRHIAGHSLVERDLLGILVLLDLPIRVLAADQRHADTRIPQISLILDVICMSCMFSNTALKPTSTAP